MCAPEAYVEWTNAHLGHNPRSQASSNALSDFVVADLCGLCPQVDAAIDSGALHVVQNATVKTRVAGRSIDLALGSRTALTLEGLFPAVASTPINLGLGSGTALTVCISVEHKTIMTAHGKARWNRYGDIIAYCNHMHNHRKECIAGAIIIVNTSPLYENPNGFAKGLVRPTFKMEKVVADTVRIFAQIPLRDLPGEPNDQPEALAVIVMNYDGMKRAELVDYLPGESQIHYDNFVARIARLYVDRFSQPQ